MTGERDWTEANGRYLSAALQWLRRRLEQEARLSRQSQVPGEPAPVVWSSREGAGQFDAAPSSGWGYFRRSTDLLPTPPALDPGFVSTGEKLLDAQMADAWHAMHEAAAISPPPALYILRDRLGLSEFEQGLLLLCLGAELDTRVPALCAVAQGDPAKAYPTFALALALFDEPSWDALSPERPLRYWRLIEIHQPGSQALTTSALRADERIVSYVKGLNYLDDRLAPLLWPLPHHGQDRLPPSQRALAASIVAQLRDVDEAPPMIELLGSDQTSKQMVAQHVAAELGRVAYRLPGDSLPGPAAELESLARLWQREATLLPLALYVDAHDLAGGSEASPTAVSRFVARATGLVFLASREATPSPGTRQVYRSEVAKPTTQEQREAWEAALARNAGEVTDSPVPGDADLPDRLAAQFDLSVAVIDRIVDTAHLAAADDPRPLADRVWATAVAQSRPQLDTLAQRIEPKATWSQLVVPDQEERALRALAAQVRRRAIVYQDWGFAERMNRGLGISALFAGESGTGKTMAAEVVANELQLALYRIDLSAVVSKYIGETEKNLRRVFDAADGGGAILFFDEADALFGKRSEVKDSHDRYANIEINYLLQRMEAFRGVTILASNMKSALDPAFMRRLRFVVTFPFPGAAERRKIWDRVFPAALHERVERLDVDRLARLPLSGGSIHNVALNAAFLAADRELAVTMPLVLEAARNELRKLELPVNESELRWAEPVEEVA